MAVIAYTFSKTRQDVWGGTKVWLGTITPLGSYASGGASVDPGNIGMRTIEAIDTLRGGSYQFFFNQATSKLQIHTFSTQVTSIGSAYQAGALVNAGICVEQVDSGTAFPSAVGAIPVRIYGLQ